MMGKKESEREEERVLSQDRDCLHKRSGCDDRRASVLATVLIAEARKRGQLQGTDVRGAAVLANASSNSSNSSNTWTTERPVCSRKD
jgi:hypothetical protein